MMERRVIRPGTQASLRGTPLFGCRLNKPLDHHRPVMALSAYNRYTPTLDRKLTKGAAELRSVGLEGPAIEHAWSDWKAYESKRH